MSTTGYVRCRICCVEECGASYAHMSCDQTTLYCDFQHVALGKPLIDFPSPGDFCQFKLAYDTHGGLPLNQVQIITYKRRFLPYQPPYMTERVVEAEEGTLSKAQQAVEDAKDAEKKEMQKKK